MKAFLGIDVGSLSAKMELLDDNKKLLSHVYLPTQGNPIAALQRVLEQLEQRLPEDVDIRGVAATGSARQLVGAIVGADCIKNEITSQAVAALHLVPGVRTVIEIGGQDSKIIIMRDGVVVDFAMNTVCAAGTGSFLDHQAQRLNVSIEQFSRMAAESDTPVEISGKCTVFTESDMIHKQQTGHHTEDIAYGLCRTLAQNYLSNVGLGKDIDSPIVFQGGVAFNNGIIRAFREELGVDIIVPEHHEITGAIGAAILAGEEMKSEASCFKGFAICRQQYSTSSFECRECHQLCQITRLRFNGQTIYSWGGHCDLFQQAVKA